MFLHSQKQQTFTASQTRIANFKSRGSKQKTKQPRFALFSRQSKSLLWIKLFVWGSLFDWRIAEETKQTLLRSAVFRRSFRRRLALLGLPVCCRARVLFGHCFANKQTMKRRNYFSRRHQIQFELARNCCEKWTRASLDLPFQGWTQNRCLLRFLLHFRCFWTLQLNLLQISSCDFSASVARCVNATFAVPCYACSALRCLVPYDCATTSATLPSINNNNNTINCPN